MNGRCRPLGRIEEPDTFSNRMPVSMRRKTRAAHSARDGQSLQMMADFGIKSRNEIALLSPFRATEFHVGGKDERFGNLSCPRMQQTAIG